MSEKYSASLDRRSGILIGAIVGGSLVLGMGVNMVLINQGILTGDSFKAAATVKHCDLTGHCDVEYDFKGEHKQAQLVSSAKEFPDGTPVRVTIFEDKLEKAYPEEVVPLGLGAVVATAGLTLLSFGSVHLFKHWRRQRLLSERINPPDKDEE